MKALTASQSRYIKALYELSDTRGVRVVDIAKKLGLSKASVSLAMTKLSERGYVVKDAYRQVRLTAAGENEAVNLLDKHEMLKAFLHDTLGVDADIAGEDALRMERVISPVTLCAICRFTRNCQNRRCKADCSDQSACLHKKRG